jgi:serine/threonine protein kinase
MAGRSNFGAGSLACYDQLDQVGEGTYGFVFKARDKRSNTVVALKRLIIHREQNGFPLCAVREIKFLKSLQHKNIVQLKDICTSKGSDHLEVSVQKHEGSVQKQNELQQQQQQPKPGNNLEAKVDDASNDDQKPSNKQTAKMKEAAKIASKREAFAEQQQLQQQADQKMQQQVKICGNLYLVFEFLEHDLGGLVDSKYKFSVKEMKCIMKQLFDVLEFLSDKKIIHRDIKSSNILLSNQHHIKLADFGLARSTLSLDGREGKIDMTNNVVTMWYKPPELLLGAVRYTYSVDMWSVGCVMAELELGRPLFMGKTEPEQLEMICKVLGSPSEENWPGVQRVTRS